MKPSVWLLALLSTFSYASTDIESMSEDDKAAYAIGVILGKQLFDSTNSVTEVPEGAITLDKEQILQGLRDGLNNMALLTKEEVDTTLKELDQRVNGLQQQVEPQDTESQFTDKMATYATIAGRSTACGLNMVKETEVVGKWMDSEFSRLSISNKMRVTYQMTFAQGMKHHMEEQLAGNSPDTCKSLKEALNNFQWPYISN